MLSYPIQRQALFNYVFEIVCAEPMLCGGGRPHVADDLAQPIGRDERREHRAEQEQRGEDQADPGADRDSLPVEHVAAEPPSPVAVISDA